MSDAYVKPEKGELWLENMHIARYAPGSYMSHEPLRRRKLLLHKKEIRNLTSKIAQKGFTLVPTKLYLKDSRAKLEIALARGKKLYNKKEDIAKRDTERETGALFQSSELLTSSQLSSGKLGNLISNELKFILVYGKITE